MRIRDCFSAGRARIASVRDSAQNGGQKRTIMAKKGSADEVSSSCAKPLIRWAGSKRRLVPELVKRTPPEYGTYYEPFAGSACLYLALKPERAILGDINPWLIGTYRTIRSRPNKIYKLLTQLRSTPETYYRTRATDPHSLDANARAVRFLYLNRHAFNGVYRENRNGDFNVPLGSKIPALPTLREFRSFCIALRPAELRVGDFQECVRDAAEGDFVYLDPPYTKAGARDRGEYGSLAFKRDDIQRLIECVKNLSDGGVKVLLSFFDSPTLRRELRDWCIESFTVSRSVSGFQSKRRTAREVLIRNY